MKKIIKRCLKIMVGIVAVVALLLAVAAWLLNTDTVQNQLMQLVSEELAERLHTRVAVDHVRVDVVRQRLKVCGISINDQQQQEMLRIEQIAAGVELLPLMHHEINITEAGVEGLKAHFYEVGEDSVPNYQFILDSLKSDKPHKADTAATPRKAKMKLNIGRVWLRQIDVTYDTHNKKGPVTLQVGLGEGDVVTRGEQYFLTLDSLLFATDNHRPRKNSGKPKRGYFDEGHLRLAAWMKVSVDYAKGDSLHAVLRQCRLSDPMTGIHVGDLRLQVGANKRQAWVSALTITWGSTNLKIDEATVQLPSKKEGRALAYDVPKVTGSVMLKDIARAFAPPLSKFSIPLRLSTRMSGTDQGMTFRNVSVTSTDKQLAIKAHGDITHLKEKKLLKVHFLVDDMQTNATMAQKIINQFSVKKLMMKQVEALGQIRYRGNVNVVWKKQLFDGVLRTDVGNVDFNFSLNNLTKYVEGQLHTDSVLLGKLFDLGKYCKAACTAHFRFDISKPRTALMRRQKGGKLPIGSVQATVSEAQLAKMKFHNIEAVVESDGALAQGNVAMRGRHTDLLCSFSFTNTESLRKMKVKPGVKFHKLSDEDRQEKEARKQAKAEEKAVRKEQKAALREQKAGEKAARKAQEAEEKAARKAQKAEEKAAKQAQRDEEKAAKKAEKEAKRAAKEAAKAERKAKKDGEQ